MGIVIASVDVKGSPYLQKKEVGEIAIEEEGAKKEREG